jgi:hypothetical protein
MTHPKAVGGDGQVEQPRRVTADLLLGSLHSRDQRGRVVQVGGAEGQGVLERAPGLTGRLGGAELGDGIVGVFLEAGLREALGASRAHDAIALGQQASRGQVEQAGKQLPPGQVSGGAEEHDDVAARAAEPSGGGHGCQPSFRGTVIGPACTIPR